MVKIFHDELTALLGGDAAPLNLEKPARILMVGLERRGQDDFVGQAGQAV